MQKRISIPIFALILRTLLLLPFAMPAVFAQPNDNPGPDDFVMMDKGAELDKKSLMQNFAYPDSAKKAGIQGTVDVHVLIGKSGKAEEYIIRAAIHPLLDSAAAQAVMKANFKPAVYEGKAIKSWMTIPIIFRIGKAKAPPPPAEDVEDSDGYTRPKYDRDAFKKAIHPPANADCVVRMRVLIGSDGKAKEMKEESQCPAELVNEVKRVIGSTAFTPATRDGKPSDDWLIINLTFAAK